MADDGTIRIGVQTDISGLKSAMAEAAATVKASTGEMDSAYQRVAAATGEYAVVSANLRAVIRQLVDGQVPYSMAVKALTPALYEQSEAAKALRAAKAELAAQEQEVTGVVEGQTVALTANAASMRVAGAAASLAGREMGGFVGAQLGRIAARSELLGPLLASPFLMAAPIIAGVGIVAYQAGTAIYNAFDLGGERARKMQEEVRKTTEALDASNISLDVQIDKLQQEQAKLEHKPFNGAKLAMDEAADAAQRLIDRLDQVIDREKLALIDMSASWAQQITGMGEGTGYEQSMIAEHSKWLGEAKTAQDALNESKSYGASLQARLNDLQAKESTAGSNIWKWTHNYDTEVQAIKQMIAWQQREQEGIQKSIDLGKQEAATQQARDAHGAAGIDDAAARQQLQSIESQFDALQAKESSLTGHGLTAGEGMAFWERYLGTFKAGSEEAKHIMEEYTRAQEQFHKELTAIVKSAKKGADEDVHMEGLGEGLNKWLATQSDNVIQAGEAWKQYHSELAKGSEMQATEAANIQIAQVHAAEAAGAITKLGADQRIAAIHAQEYAIKLKMLSEELDRLKKAGTYDAVTGQNLDPKNAAQQQQVQNQIVQLSGQAKVSGIFDQSAVTQQIASPYLKAFDQINSSWLQVQNQMFYSTRNLGLAFAKMGQQILISIVDNMERAALVSIEKELTMTLAHQAAVTTRVATDASGSAASLSISRSTEMQEKILDAKSAFHKTYKVVSGWPVVGPILAPVLAAAAFTAVAAFETGTPYVPQTGMALLHEGEAVIPSGIADKWRDGDGPGGGDLHIHNTNNINAPTEKAILRALDRNPHVIAQGLQRHLRQGGNA